MANQRNIGAFLPTTNIFDPTSLGDGEVSSAKFKEFLVLQFQSYNNVANIVNLKDTGYYLPTEINTSQNWFQPTSVSPDASLLRNSFRTVVNFGALPNAGTKTVAHNIEGITAGVFSWTKIQGTATDPSANGIPLPYSSSVLNENIILQADATNVTITTAIDYSAYTVCYVVLEYLKN